MSLENEEIIAMVNMGATLQEICEVTNLSPKQLYYRLFLLKANGYNFYKSFYATGDIFYKLMHGDRFPDCYSIITAPGENELEMVVISDTHAASVDDRMDLLTYVYDYCLKNNIHIVLNGGDLVDGTVGKSPKKYTKGIDQVNYFLDNYPLVNNVITFMNLGNHDKSLVDEFGIDLKQVLLARRHDLVPLGYGSNKLRIKKDAIFIKHPVKCEQKLGDIKNSLILNAHSHNFKIILTQNSYKIVLPSLSNVGIPNFPLPGFLKLKLTFRNGVISYVHIIQYMDLNGIWKVGEESFNINSEPKYPKTLEEVLVPYSKREKSRKLERK